MYFFRSPSHWTEWSGSPCPSLLDVEPGEDVDYAHHHVKHNLLPLADAEVCLAVHNPEGHDAPVQDNEDAKVELEYRGKQGEGDDPRSDSEEVPTELDDDSQVADGLLVITRLSQGLLVGGQGPGQRDKGGRGGHSCNIQAQRQHMMGTPRKRKHKSEYRQHLCAPFVDPVSVHSLAQMLQAGKALAENRV